MDPGTEGLEFESLVSLFATLPKKVIKKNTLIMSDILGNKYNTNIAIVYMMETW